MQVQVTQDAEFGPMMDLLVKLVQDQRGLVVRGKGPAMGPSGSHQEAAGNSSSTSCQNACARTRTAMAVAARYSRRTFLPT
jgi:hypothetical protein